MRAHVIRVWNEQAQPAVPSFVFCYQWSRRVSTLFSLFMESYTHSSTDTLSLCIWTLFVSLSVFERKGNKLSLKFSLQKSIFGSTFSFPMWLCISFLSIDVEQFKASISRILGGLLLFSVWFSEYPFRYKLGIGPSFVGFPALKWFEQTLAKKREEITAQT